MRYLVIQWLQVVLMDLVVRVDQILQVHPFFRVGREIRPILENHWVPVDRQVLQKINRITTFGAIIQQI